MKLRYWDSVVWLSVLKKEKDRAADCQILLNEARSGDFKIITSAITLTEVVHIKGYERLNSTLESQIKAFFEHEFIIVRGVDRRTAEMARSLMWEYNSQGLRHKDAVHAATAVLANVDVLNTYDSDLLNMDNQILCNEGKLLSVKAPYVAQAPLLQPQDALSKDK